MKLIAYPRWTRLAGVVLAVLGEAAAAQGPVGAPVGPPAQNPSEMASRDEPATFQARVNLVMVPVVVRDRQNKVVGNLRKEDFVLADKGKPQEISRFTVEKPGAPPAYGTAAAQAAVGESTEPAGIPASAPERYIGYLFDDVHLQPGDLMRVREAADRHMNNELRPSDRAAIFSTSGQVEQDFTDDLAKLHQTLLRLMPRPIARVNVQQCPDITFYMADMIVNRHDPMAMSAAVAESMTCQQFQGSGAQQQAQQYAQSVAQQVLSAGDHETRVTLTVLMDAVRRMAAMPGQRTLILVSPGFYTMVEHQQDKMLLLDRAIRANVVINTLNARGLYTIGMDASQQVFNGQAQIVKNQYATQTAMAEEDVLAELAYGTGGNFFHNNNDLYEGFGRMTALPEVYYMLGFQPQNLKLDGSFHALKVTLASKTMGALSVQARRGYYAPTHLEDAAELAKREIAEALFSREEMHEFPAELHTQFFKSSATSATVAVLAHLDLKHIRFRKADGRNVDTVTVVSGLFDRNGNYIKGLMKTIQFHLKDGTLESRLEQGITVRNTMEVKPGVYVVRLVVRDSEGQTMAAANGSVEIP